MAGAEETGRVCPECEKPVVPVNIVDLVGGAVTFDCGSCGAPLHDNAERTSLKVWGRGRNKKTRKAKQSPA